MCIQLSTVVLRNDFPLIQPVKHVVLGLKAPQNLHEVRLTARRNKEQEGRESILIGNWPHCAYLLCNLLTGPKSFKFS